MRVLATVSSVLAAMLLLLPWQLCTCTEDGAHLKPLWDHSACDHDHLEHDQSQHDDSEQCDEIFRFVGSEGDLVVDLPSATDGPSLLLIPTTLAATDIAVAERAEDPPDRAGGVRPPDTPVSSGTRLLL